MFLKRIKEVVCLTPISTSIWFLMLAFSTFLTYHFHLSWLFIPIFALAFLFLHEIFAFFIFGRGLFPSAERVARMYQWPSFFMDGYEKADFNKIGDLTEGYFDNNFDKTIAQATSDKFDEIIKLLNLKKGYRILDVGCGLGDFLFHLKQKGIEGVGLTISPDQQRIAASRGIDVRYFDFRQPLPEDLKGKFDAVIFMGCLEHFVQFYSTISFCYRLIKRIKKNNHGIQVYHRAFESAYQALSPQSSVRKIFSTTLHVNKDYYRWDYNTWSLLDWVHVYFLHGHYSGNYPDEGDLPAASQPYFKVTYQYDATIDYQYSSIASSDHFGDNKIKWTIERIFFALLLAIVNPFSWATWLYHYLGTWMWQFGGKKIVPNQNRPMKTIWYVYEATSA